MIEVSVGLAVGQQLTFPRGVYTVVLDENKAAGTVLYQLGASLPGSNAPVTYSLATGNEGGIFTLDTKANVGECNTVCKMVISLFL